MVWPVTCRSVDFELSDEHKMFRDTLRSFVNREIKPVAREWEQSGRYPHEIVATMAEMGLFGLTISEEHGGSVAGPAARQILAVHYRSGANLTDRLHSG